VSGDVTATSRGAMTSSSISGSGSSLLHVWCTANSQQHLLPHLLHQHIASRFHNFRSCYTLPPEITSSTWAAPETQDRRQQAEELSEPEFEEDEEDGTDSEAARRAGTPARVEQGRVMACRKKKTRTVFSRAQVLQLESTFDAKRYLSSAERSNLASSLRLTETQVTSAVN